MTNQDVIKLYPEYKSDRKNFSVIYGATSCSGKSIIDLGYLMPKSWEIKA